MIALNENHQDRELLMRAARGCRESLEIVWHKYAADLCVKLAKTCGAHTAEDVCQTVYLRLCAKECRYPGNCDVQGYLFGMAKRILADYFRAENQHVRTSCLHDVETQYDLPGLTQNDTHMENLQIAETLQALTHCIENLPPKTRQAVKLVHQQGYEPSESAPKLGCSVKTLHARLQYGISKLREDLGQSNRK